jgi:hypothetical protein
MPLGVGPSATKSSSEHPTRERQNYPSPRHHPYQRLSSYQGSSTSHRETRSRRTNLSANDEGHYFRTTVGDLGVARPNEDSLEYAARLAARAAKAEDDGGTSNSKRAVQKLTPLIVISPFPSSLINPITHLSYHRPEWATKVDTLALLKPSPLPFANCHLSIPSFVFAAAVASVGPHSLVQPARSSPPSTPIQPGLIRHVRANVERTDREKLAQKLNEHLETLPEPIVGSIDNPFSFAEKYGIRGASILSVFFDHVGMDTFTCHFCKDEHDTIDDALEHQRTARHYNE